MALAVGFLEPTVSPEGDRLRVPLETRGVLTDRMRDLLDHGLIITIKLDASLKIEDAGGLTVRIYRQARRSLRFDALGKRYLMEEAGSIRDFSSLATLEAAARFFPILDFELPQGWKSASLYARLSLVDDEVLTGRLGIPASTLWDGYNPTVLHEWKASK